MRITRRQLRNIIAEALGSARQGLLSEELTRTDKKEIERIARKQAQKEIVKVVGNDLAKTIKEEVKRVLKNKATKDEIADVTRAVIKKIIDEIKI
ncbi:MAG TPA: hypothetical protein EYG51_24040 [Pseudomonadales bacterium]|nr:hypothetical protein [Pseudomonadales bacterium]